MPRKASLLAVALFGTVAGWPLGPTALGITEAAAGTYTRKRVNGRWITGRFTDASVRQRYASLPPEPVERPLPPPRPGDRRSQADRVIATASLTPAPAEGRLETMRPALEAKARALAGDALALPLPEPPPALPDLLAAR